MIYSFDFFDGAWQAQVFRFMLHGGNHSNKRQKHCNNVEKELTDTISGHKVNNLTFSGTRDTNHIVKVPVYWMHANDRLIVIDKKKDITMTEF